MHMDKIKKQAGKVIKRLLGKQYPQDLIGNLCVLEEHARRWNYSEEELDQMFPFLKGMDWNKISETRKLSKELKKQLVEEINRLIENKGTLYEITVLCYALYTMSYSTERIKGLDRRNSKVAFAWNYIDMIMACGSNERHAMLCLRNIKFD